MDILMFADSRKSADMRHAVPISIGDPFVYAEHGGRRFVSVPSLEMDRVQASGEYEVIPFDALGLDELRGLGVTMRSLRTELLYRACCTIGIEEAAVPPDFPVVAADLLRERGLRLHPDAIVFTDRRRAKSALEIEGIRRAQAATDAAMEAVRDSIQRGGTVSAESLRVDARQAASNRDVSLEIMVIAHGIQAAAVHEAGWGRIAAGEPIVVDFGFRDRETGTWSDMTRTFCMGDPPAELVDYHRLCREVHELVTPLVKPGVTGAELHQHADTLIAGAGYPTILTKKPGNVLDSGFFHSLGHGVGLEVHEPPSVGLNGEDLVAGDVITIEPGVYRPGFGGCRLENLVLVTEAGCEVLTPFPLDL